MKKTITHVLLYFVVASVGFLAGKYCRTEPSAPAPDQLGTGDATPAPDQLATQSLMADGVEVGYYFMGVKRCDACISLGDATQAVAETLIDKGVRYAFIDCDKKENDHHKKRLELMYKIIVVSVIKDGKYVSIKKLNMSNAFGLVNESIEAYKQHLREIIESKILAYQENES